ncbi:MAG: serine/threonine protein kinase [Planctomycetes bacterium]|nr:serine/threonine protein kinase [Planctomycetota bacterium]
MAKGSSAGGSDDRPQSAAATPQEASKDPVRAPTPDDAHPAPLPDMTSRMLGDFRILRKLGQGGMAEVYLAEQTSLKRNVAVKVLHTGHVVNDSYLERFQTEALAAASLNHPNIVQVLVVGAQDGIQYIAQEYVPGMNLRELLAKKGPPEQALAIRIIRQVANALHVAHTAGVVHRDIKPENIMITRKGEVKVADFGLAKLVDDQEQVRLTADGTTMGTPLYMSPEQVDGKPVDHRSDIYSLGVTCYHMLSGAPPFRGPTAISVAIQHLKKEPDALEPLREDLSPALCRMVHKMMAKDPDQRYQSAQAILKDLKRLTTEGDLPPEKPAKSASVVRTPPPRSAARHPVLRFLQTIWYAPDAPVFRQVWTLLLLGLLVGGASAGAGWFTRTPDPFATAARQESHVPRKETAAGQYFYAVQQKDNIEAWQAVVENFPGSNDRLFRNYAEQQIAMLCLAKRRYDEAQSIFDQFAEFNEPQFRAFGLAGQAMLQNLAGDYQRSQQIVDKLRSPVRPSGVGEDNAGKGETTARPVVFYDLLDDKMRSAVMETMHRNIEKLNQQMSQEWDEIFKKQDQTFNGTGPSSEGAK